MPVLVDSLEVQIKTQANNTSKAIRSLTDALTSLRSACQNGAGLKEVANAMERIARVQNNGLSAVKDFGKNMADVKNSTQGVADSFEDTASAVSTVGKSAEGATSSLDEIKGATARAKKEIDDSAKAFKKVGDSIKKTDGLIKRLFATLNRLIILRALRSAILQFANAWKEGLENAYQFSKLNNGVLASSLDSLTSKMNALKNQAGSAFGELVIAITPALQNIIQSVTKVLDVLSQVFAVFNGKAKYMRAKEISSAWKDATKSAKEYKSQTLGIDELNIISKDNGGSGSSSTDYGNMYEDADISLPDGVKKAIEWVHDHLKEISTIVSEIGLALLAWKLSNKFLNGLDGMLEPLLTLAGGVIILTSVFDSFENGINWKNILGVLGGMALLSVGLAMSFGVVGIAIGLLVGGIALLVMAFAEVIKKGELTNGALTAFGLGLAVIGVAIGLLTGSWIPLLIAGVAWLVTAIWKHGDAINEIIDGVWDKWNGFIQSLIDSPNVISKIFGYILKTLNIAIGSIKGVIQGAITFVKQALDGIIQVIEGIFTLDFKTALRGILNIVFALLNGINIMISNVVNAIVDAINSVGFEIPDWIPIWGGKSFKPNIPHWNPPELKAENFFANGGFPQSGSMFFANENGASEYVGSWGNQSAVANSDQIIQGIQEGVSIAVSSTLAPYLSQIATNTRETANKDFSVNIGDRDIAKANARGQRAMGRTLISTI